MDNKERQRAVLEDTIKHYNTGNRSIDANGRCVYYPSEKSEGCAVGRLVKDKELCKAWNSEGLYGVFNQLPKELSELGALFLHDLQRLHDNADNWNEMGISKVGEDYVTVMKQRHSLNF